MTACLGKTHEHGVFVAASDGSRLFCLFVCSHFLASGGGGYDILACGKKPPNDRACIAVLMSAHGQFQSLPYCFRLHRFA